MIAAAVATALLIATTQQPVPPQVEPSDDVVVTGLRDLDDPGSLVTHRTLGSARVGPGAVASRQLFALSMRYATCVVKDDPSMVRLLRPIIDGNINSARQRFALGRLAQVRSACANDPNVARNSGMATTSNLYDPSYYDRGALIIQAIRTFAPTLSLTKRQTGDPEVQRRFNAREIPRARFRLPVDRKYFEFAVCFVREQPEYAVRLATTTGSIDTVARLEAAIVNGGRACVGAARQVYFDASQFRFYIADAVYRWAVAARDVDSLLPPDPVGNRD